MDAKLIIQSKREGFFSMTIWTSCTLLYVLVFTDYTKNCRTSSVLHFETLHRHELGKFPANLSLVQTNSIILSSETSFIS